MLRRESLYSSLLTAWRREAQTGMRQALTPQKRGPKSQRDALQEENQKLQKENARLVEELRKAAIVIDVQNSECLKVVDTHRAATLFFDN